jgi:hypothetical protein
MTASANFVAGLSTFKNWILSPVRFNLYIHVIHVGLLSYHVYRIIISVYFLLMTDAVSAIDGCKNGSNAEVDERKSSRLY